MFGTVCVHFHLLSQLRKVRCISVKIKLVCGIKKIVFGRPSSRRGRSIFVFFVEACSSFSKIFVCALKFDHNPCSSGLGLFVVKLFATWPDSPMCLCSCFFIWYWSMSDLY